MKIKVIKFDGYQEPIRAHYNDSGADVYAKEDVWLWPNGVYKIPTGVGLELPDGYDAVIHCKSGLSSKGIIAMNAPIDAGYRGEIHAILANLGTTKVKIEKGQKIGQIVVRPVVYCEFVDELGKERKDGAFGSTGK